MTGEEKNFLPDKCRFSLAAVRTIQVAVYACSAVSLCFFRSGRDADVGRLYIIYVMTRLSVNVNKVATLRNARGENNPDVVKTALDCERFGAQGITVHPRPDERHIRYQDVRDLSRVLTTEFNIEGYPNESFCDLVCQVRPAQVTLVPDAPGQLTSDHGWDVPAHSAFLKDVIARFRESGIRTSLFVSTDEKMADSAQQVGADRIEMYTAPYAHTYAADRDKAVAPFVRMAEHCRELGLDINAGHDLSLENLAFFHQAIPWLDEVSIGHALICDALYLGWQETIRRYLDCLK